MNSTTYSNSKPPVFDMEKLKSFIKDNPPIKPKKIWVTDQAKEGEIVSIEMPEIKIPYGIYETVLQKAHTRLRIHPNDWKKLDIQEGEVNPFYAIPVIFDSRR